jgi:hypothetical protein
MRSMTVTTTLPDERRPDTRETRALALYRAHRREIVLIDRNTYEVPSQDGTRTYEVVYGGDTETCTCPDATYRSVACVHLYAVGIHRAKRRGDSARLLAKLEDRHRHGLMDPDERCELGDVISRLRRKLGL